LAIGLACGEGDRLAAPRLVPRGGVFAGGVGDRGGDRSGERCCGDRCWGEAVAERFGEAVAGRFGEAVAERFGEAVAERFGEAVGDADDRRDAGRDGEGTLTAASSLALIAIPPADASAGLASFDPLRGVLEPDE
jgi:hypothetical protein